MVAGVVSMHAEVVLIYNCRHLNCKLRVTCFTVTLPLTRDSMLLSAIAELKPDKEKQRNFCIKMLCFSS